MVRPLAFILAAVAWLVGAVYAQPAPLSAVELLDRYDRGEYDTVLKTFVSAADTDALRKNLERDGPGWIAGGGAALEPRRRLVAATMALEFAHARMVDEWMSVRSLVEWGCEQLRKAPPSEPERQWQLAAIAVAGGAMDNALLFNARTGLRTYRHHSHAEQRFPSDPRIAFASRFVVPGPPAEGSESFQAGAEPPVDQPRLQPGSRTKDRDKAIERLDALTGDPVVGAEAQLRIGHLQLVSLKLGEALEAFQGALRSNPTPYVAHLAHFLSGRVYERVDRADSAEQAYARALAAVPHAQSAVLARSALLTRAGRTSEAASLAEASFRARPRPPDPWRLFPRGDYYRWPELIAGLRAELRR